MLQFNLHVWVFFTDVLGGLFGEIYGTVLAAGAPEADHQVVEMTFQIVVNGLLGEGEDVFTESVDGRVLLQILDDTGVLPGEGSVLWLPTWIGERPAVEHKTAAIG